MVAPLSPPFLPAAWAPEAVAAIRPAAETTIPRIALADCARAFPTLDLWDLWPLQRADGTTAIVDGWSLWFVLSAPALPDPEARHDIARIRLFGHDGAAWHDLGNALPDGLNPGTREWAGSALLDPASGAVTLYWTAAGLPGEAARSFVQRMFETTGRLTGTHATLAIGDWSAPRPIAAGAIAHYREVTQGAGVPGFIKGFRDPAHYQDPADGARYLLFTGSLQASESPFDGCIGLLRAEGDSWRVLPPLMTADGLNNEQERPHIVRHGGLCYLFWSTQRKVFAPGGPSGPNGLYGMVAESIHGPWRPLNGTGLVAANPDDAQFQAYSWWVTADLTVHAFVDYPGPGEGNQTPDPEWRRAHFGGVPAPVFALVLDGESAAIRASEG